MNIGMIGAGNIAGTVGPLWARAGHIVRYGARDPGRPGPLLAAAGAGVTIGTMEDAAAFGEVVFCSFPYGVWPDVSRIIGPLVGGKIVLDSANAYPERDGAFAQAALEAGQGTGVPVARLLAGARLVRAFNSVYFKTLASEAHRAGDQVGIPLAGDDHDALAIAATLVRDAGFAPVVVGPLQRARDFDPGTAVYNTGMSGRVLALDLAVEPTDAASIGSVARSV